MKNCKELFDSTDNNVVEVQDDDDELNSDNDCIFLTLEIINDKHMYHRI